MTSFDVAVVDDDPGSRRYISEALQAEPRLNLSFVAENLAEGTQYLKDNPPRVLLIDLGLPDGSGLELIELARQFPETDSMVISVFEDEYHVVKALEMGATGYLLKDSLAQSIVANVLALIRGGSPISPAIARHLLKRFNSQTIEDQPGADQPGTAEVGLTNRELEVLKLVAKGYKRREISDKLFVSVDTVGSHIHRIYKKLAVNSNIEAIRKGTHLGLL